MTLETFYIINQVPKIDRTHWNLPWMCCFLKFRSLKISLETLERSFHREEKTEISREASWDIWNSPLYPEFPLYMTFLLQWKLRVKSQWIGKITTQQTKTNKVNTVSCILLNILACIYRFESFTWIPIQILYIHGHFKLRNMKLHVLMIKLTHWAWAACGRVWVFALH